MDLASYRTLGRSGLVVSPLALGAMTFGAARWGAADADARAIFDAYVDAGGNFVDTADVYSGGRSEELVGRFVAERGMRDQVVIATKSGFSTAKHPHAGGNGAKHVRAALDGSLRRLGTDHVDLYWTHVWDMVTPPEEVLDTLASLVRAGKIRYYGLSNCPAWYAARIATLAGAHGLPGPIALQHQYSLLDRHVEYELIPAARALGLGMVPWSPLGGGFLSGKYDRSKLDDPDLGRPGALPSEGGEAARGEEGRLDGPNPFGDMLFTPRNFDVLDALRAVAGELGRPPAQVALAWALARPAVDALLIGASRPDQVDSAVASLGVELSPDHRARLDRATAPAAVNPYFIFDPAMSAMTFGGPVRAWRG